MSPGGPFWARRVLLAWVAVPVAVHLFVLSRFWFDAPILDDYDLLQSLNDMARAGGVGEWLRQVFALQNEHRLAVTRLVLRAVAWVPGGIDFRALMLLGTLCMLGTLAFLWLEFRERATGPIAAAAAFLLLQWSYNEALLMASASTAHLAVVFFAFGGLYFALRPGWRSAALCVAGGVLATYSQANGLFVLPLAGVACLLLGQRRRAVLFLAAGALLWIVYFIGYVGNPNHPPLLKALEDPVKTFQLFLIIIGGVVPSLALAQLYGAAILAGVAWFVWKGLWRRHPTAFLWIAFVLVTAATVAVARVGFGLFHGSRYAVNAALLLAILVFAIHSMTQPWRAGLDRVAFAAAAVAWAAITLAALPEMRERSFRGRLLVEVEGPAASLGLGRFAGVHHPGREHAARILAAAVEHGWYVPRRYAVEIPAVDRTDRRPLASRTVGVMDEVTPSGRNVILRGWTDIAAVVPGRKFTIYPATDIQALRVESLAAREDVAVHLQRPNALLSGFHLVAEYPSEDAARKAAQRLCIFVEGLGHALTQVVRTGMTCN